MSSTRSSSPDTSSASSSSANKKSGNSDVEELSENFSSSMNLKEKSSGKDKKSRSSDKTSSCGRAKDTSSSASASKIETSRARSRSKGATTAARRAAQNAPTTWDEKWEKHLTKIGQRIIGKFKGTGIKVEVDKLEGSNDEMNRADVFWKVTNSNGKVIYLKTFIFDNRFSTDKKIGVITMIYEGYTNPVSGLQTDLRICKLEINHLPPAGVDIDEHYNSRIFKNYCDVLICFLTNAARE